MAAGGSVEIGVPSTVAATARLLEDDPAERHSDTDRELTVLRRLHAVLATRYPMPTFEHILHALEAAVSLQRSWNPSTHHEYLSIFGVLSQGPLEELRDLFDDHLAATTAGTVLHRLQRLFSGHPRDRATEAWPKYERFWSGLARTFDLDVATTNYDEAIEGALPSIEQGFEAIDGENVRRFDARVLRAATMRLAHLHGSVRFGYREYGTDANRFWAEDSWDDLYLHPSAASAGISWGGRSSHNSQAGEETIVGPLISGLQKPNKLIAAEPYSSYYAALGEWLQTNSRLLVVGYGFGDLHLNKLLQRMSRWHGPARRIALITLLPERDWIHTLHGFARGHELEVVSGWTEEPRAWHDRNTFRYENPWISLNGCCRLYLSGLIGTVTTSMEDLLAFLA
jgi:SIR2-like protein